MFPPKTIGIIGNKSKMARNIYEPLFREAGLGVIGSDISDPDGLTNQQVVGSSDVVFFSILPLDEVALEMRRQIPNSKAATLWLHGSSVQEVRDFSISEVLLDPELEKRGVDVGLAHFMINHTVKTLKGQNIVVDFPRKLLIELWKEWFIEILEGKRARIREKGFREHDVLTKGTQLLPMIMSVATGMVWVRENMNVSEAMGASGPPAKFQNLGIIRSLGNEDVVAEIITRHPDGPGLIRVLAEIFQDLVGWIDEKNTEEIKKQMRLSKQQVSQEDMKKILAISDWLITALGDLSSNSVTFEVGEENNQIGLLAKLAGCFDEQGIDKNSTIAQALANHSARFSIGLEAEIEDPKVQVAIQKAASLGAKLVESDFIL